MSGYIDGIVAIFAINVLLAYAVYLPAATGLMNLGVAGFMAIGAYVSAFLDGHYAAPVWLTLLAGSAASLIVALALAVPILRTSGIYFVLATFAFGEIVAGIIVNINAVGGAAGFPVTAFAGTPALIAAACVVAALATYLMATRIGLAMRSIHDDEAATSLFGIDVRGVKVFAFTAGAAIAGLAGALYGHHYNFVDVAQFNLTLSIYTLLFVLIGGTQTPFGPIVGAAVFSFVPEILRASMQWRYVIFAVIIIAVMALRSEGIVTRSALRRLTVRVKKASA